MVIPKRKTGAALQAAIDEAAKGDTADDRVVFLPPGVYRLKSKPICLRNGVKIVGQGKT
ncbi:MAG: glycosyl hydrolase family 28-related protein [Chitinispirillaceae bacterium]|jgi:polygalacturonase